MRVLFVLLVAIIAIAGVQGATLEEKKLAAMVEIAKSLPEGTVLGAGIVPDCDEDDKGELKCCITVAQLGNQGVCATVDYKEGEGAIVVAVTLAGLPIFRKEFTNLTTDFCVKILSGKVCVAVTNPSFAASGACGCLQLTLNFGFPLPIRIGCFAFGQSCFETNCEDYNYKCEPCSILNSCGWCKTTKKCVRGGSQSPDQGSCPNWAFKKQEC